MKQTMKHTQHRTNARPPAQQLREQRAQEAIIYGENSCRATLQHRFEDVVKAFFTPEVAPRLGQIMRALAEAKKAYKIVEEDELERMTGSMHHGGMSLVVKKPPVLSVAGYLKGRAQATSDCVLALENVSNPHNLGAMMRSAAHFGVKGLVLPDPDLLFSGSAARVAEGGAEVLYPIEAADFVQSLSAFKDAGYALVTTSSHRGKSLYHAKLPKKVVIVLGEEQSGVSKKVATIGDLPIKIPGTGAVESLNVSVATALILGEWWRQSH
jgi:TrmH RNA methyltransferase